MSFRKSSAARVGVQSQAASFALMMREAHARRWFAERGYAIVLLEHDNDCDGVDIMPARHGALCQFAINKAR
jgi:hypothetical protein